VTTLAEATRIIGWYGVRWGIEVFHKVQSMSSWRALQSS
jgi:hypothetical protein